MPVLRWTDERIKTLRSLWLSGRSASQVAVALGGVTRNAVIGKVHRLGLAGRAAAAVCRSLPKAPRAEASPPRAGRRAPKPPVMEAPPLVADLTWLARSHCRWPIGDPATAGFGFCGQAPLGDGPYCERHHARAYRGPAPRLDADRLAPGFLAQAHERGAR